MGRCQIGSLGLWQARRRISGWYAVGLVGVIGATLDHAAGSRSLPGAAGTTSGVDRATPASCSRTVSLQFPYVY